MISAIIVFICSSAAVVPQPSPRRSSKCSTMNIHSEKQRRYLLAGLPGFVFFLLEMEVRAHLESGKVSGIAAASRPPVGNEFPAASPREGNNPAILALIYNPPPPQNHPSSVPTNAVRQNSCRSITLKTPNNSHKEAFITPSFLATRYDRTT